MLREENVIISVCIKLKARNLKKQMLKCSHMLVAIKLQTSDMV